MSSRYLKNNTKAKKGISPVIATVILVAVAVVIAAALAGFSSSLFGSYSQNAQIQIRSSTMDVDGVGQLDIVNTGASSETVSRVSANIAGVTFEDPAPEGAAPTDPPVIQANSDGVVNFDLVVAPALDEGQSVSITVTTTSGQQYTLSTRVTS